MLACRVYVGWVLTCHALIFLLFALCSGSAVYSLRDRFSLTKIKEYKNQKNTLPEACQIRAIVNLIHRTDEEARTQAEEVKLFPLSVFSFQVRLPDKCWGEIVYPATSGLLLRKQNISIFCASVCETAKDFFLEKICENQNLLQIFFMCTYKYYMSVCNRVWNYIIQYCDIKKVRAGVAKHPPCIFIPLPLHLTEIHTTWA